MAPRRYLAIADVAASFGEVVRQASDSLATAVEDMLAEGDALPTAIEDGKPHAVDGPGVRIVIATETG